MSIRTHIFLSSLFIAIIPIALLAWFFRAEMSERLGEQYGHRVEALVTVIEDDLIYRTERIGMGLSTLKESIRDDNRLRGAIGGNEDERQYLLDFAMRSQNLMGLDMLQIQDTDGRIISSGHYRNEFDRIERDLPLTLGRQPNGTALAKARRPAGPFLALVRVDSVALGSQRFHMVGGIEVDADFLRSLVPDLNMAAALLVPDGAITSGNEDLVRAIVEVSKSPTGDGPIRRAIDIPMITGGGARTEPVRLVVAHGRGPLALLLDRLDRWFAIAIGLSAGCALFLAFWMSFRISRPIRRLASKAATIDLDRLDIDFGGKRRDEVGALGRLLDEMTTRLRASAVKLRDTERRATLGEIARQINHDLRNGLTPIRNVFRHLTQVGHDEPHRLGAIFEERRGTIDSGLNYLEDLSRNYSRLSSKGMRAPCDLNRVIRELISALAGGGPIQFITELAQDLPSIMAENTGLRRIVENLVRNSMESLPDSTGTIIVTTRRITGEDGIDSVILSVKDDGQGMDEKKCEKIFDHFFTDKDGGTGLGLSIVRRHVTDYEGTIAVKSAIRKGTLITITFPALAGGAPEEENR